MTEEAEEDLVTIAYMYGFEEAKSQWVKISEEEIIEGIKKTDPGRMDLCPWSFRKGVEFAEQKLKERNT